MKLTNLFNNYAFLLSIILFTILPVKSQTNILTFNETLTKGGNLPRVFAMDKFDDNTIVVHIIRRNSIPTEGKICVDDLFSFHVIYPDGKSKAVLINLKVQPINYCIIDVNYFLYNPIKIYTMRTNLLLVTFTEAEDENNVYTYMEYAKVVDLSGKVLSTMLLGPSFVDAENKWIPNKAKIKLNVNREKGFVRVGPITNTTNALLQQFVITDSGEIQNLTEDIVILPNYLDLVVKPVATIEGGYAIIYANATNTILNDPFLPQGGIYAMFLTYGQNFNRQPVVIYQTQISGLSFTGLNCDIAYVGFGQICILTGNFINQPAPNTFFIRIDFLSSGTLYNVQSLNATQVGVTEYKLRALKYGGYILMGIREQTTTNDAAQRSMYGYIIGDSGEQYSWNFDNPSKTNFNDVYVILSNNTFVLSQPEVGQSWSLITTNLYKFSKDQGYSNFHVETTTPSIGDEISFDTEFISIKYYEPVDLSIGNITIIQDNPDREIIRQITSGDNKEFVNLSEDGTTVYVKIIKSTFNQPGGRYYILINNNFVKSRTYQEPLYGIKKNLWYFTTLPEERNELSSSRTTGRVRLTPEGTVYFESLDDDGRKDFYAKLRQELADAIPIDPRRVTTNEKFETDTSTSPKQFFLSINIEQDDNRQIISVASAVKDLNTLIKNKPYTAIANGESTSYLDQSFGYKPSTKFLQENYRQILAVLIAICLFILLYLWAKQRNMQAKNIIILQFGLIMFDCIMDILFVAIDAKAVDKIFIPSIISVVVPSIVNTGLAFIIISKENNNMEFLDWVKNNTQVVAIFTLLAGADIEVLNILNSKIGGYEFFNAKFSQSASNKIFWGGCVNVLIEDLPQMIIQIIYFNQVVHYDIIPLLTLISSTLSLLVDIIGRLYYVKHALCVKNYEHETISNDLLNIDDKHNQSHIDIIDKSESSSDNYRNSGNVRDETDSFRESINIENKEKNPYYP